MVQKTRNQQYQADDDIPASQQSINDLQAQITDLVAAVDALTTQRAIPPPRQGQVDRAYESDGNGEENPFAALRQQCDQRVNRRTANNSDS